MGEDSCQVVGLGQCCWDRFELVDHFPRIDEKVESRGSLEQGGGPVATALATLARFGASCSFCGSVGSDREGELILQSLQRETIDCEFVEVDPVGASQRATIIVESTSGLRTIFWQRGARRPFAVSPRNEQLIKTSRVLLLDGLEVEGALQAARIARSSGVVTVLDGGSVREGTQELLPLIDHLVVCEKFAYQLSGSKEPGEVLKALMAHGAKAATLTLGVQGSWTVDSNGQFHQPAFPVAAVDTTGCGDVFHGGYVFGLLQNWPLSRVIRFAAASAALNAMHLGGRGGLPTLTDVLHLEESVET